VDVRGQRQRVIEGKNTSAALYIFSAIVEML
jgi:hypothetical protein